MHAIVDSNAGTYKEVSSYTLILTAIEDKG